MVNDEAALEGSHFQMTDRHGQVVDTLFDYEDWAAACKKVHNGQCHTKRRLGLTMRMTPTFPKEKKTIQNRF